MATTDVPRKLWEHPNPRSTQMYLLMQEINRKENLKLEVCPSESDVFILQFFLRRIPPLDLLGVVPVLYNPALQVLGPGFPVPRNYL